MNLTLAGCQSRFVKNYINIVPVPVKYIFEKIPMRFQKEQP
ncbi:Uncharacterised protein [Bacteroides eggerthii]|uniref:Uncharacterized protein n=1 Tax=Bacteroides eggerthii TaxID=28111 RepID=A0A380YJ69_9BACE|nr:Uncharacterised protein [Bacteroides eggerthii]